MSSDALFLNSYTLNSSNLTADIVTDDAFLNGSIVVRISTYGLPVDRTYLYGISLKKTHLKLAERLKAAILAGAVFGLGTVHVDVNGKSFIHADCKVLGRTLNADLKRLGF